MSAALDQQAPNPSLWAVLRKFSLRCAALTFPCDSLLTLQLICSQIRASHFPLESATPSGVVRHQKPGCLAEVFEQIDWKDEKLLPGTVICQHSLQFGDICSRWLNSLDLELLQNCTIFPNKFLVLVKDRNGEYEHLHKVRPFVHLGQ